MTAKKQKRIKKLFSCYFDPKMIERLDEATAASRIPKAVLIRTMVNAGLASLEEHGIEAFLRDWAT